MYRTTSLLVLQLLAVVCWSQGDLDISLQHMSALSSEPVVLEVDPSRTIELVDGTSYLIACFSIQGGFGNQQEVWLKGDVPVTVITGSSTPSAPSVYVKIPSSNKRELYFSQFNNDAVGTYTCNNGNGDNDATLVIGITSSLTVITGNPNISLNSGSLAFIPALIAFVSGNPQPQDDQISWLFNGESLSHSGKILSLSTTITVNDAGTYTVTASTTSGTDSASFRVDVNVQPEVALIPSDNLMLVEGSDLNLTCSDTVGMPSPTFQWLKDGLVIAGDGSRVVITNNTSAVTSTLVISPLEPGDAADYVCRGSNKAGSSNSYISLEVWYAPILEITSNRTIWIVGDTLHLEASLTGANPMAITTTAWFKNSVVVPVDQRSTQNNGPTIFSLDLRNLVILDEGLFELRVGNIIGPRSVFFDITVESPPILTSQEGINYARNSAPSTSLSVSIQGAKPAVTEDQLQWSVLRPGETVPQVISLGSKYTSSLGGDGSTLVLSLNNLILTDSGLYGLSVTHSAGRVTLQLQLRVQNPPAAPTNINSISLSPCSARITWDTPLAETNETAPADYIIIESLVNGESSWVELGMVHVSEMSLDAKVPGSGLNTVYQLRGRSFSDRNGIGEGLSYISSQSFMAYTEEDYLPVQSLGGLPASPTSIRLSWDLPQQDCFNFTSHSLSCSTGTSEPTTSSVTGSLLTGVVTGLNIDTLYNCSVASVMTDSLRGSFTLTTVTRAVLAFTYPDNPPQPASPKADLSNPPTLTAISVIFQLPSNREDISHYQIFVLRLNNDFNAPSSNPDSLYPPGYEFDTYTDVHGPDSSKRTTFKPYIAAEVSGENFSDKFVIGDGLQSNSSTQGYVNDKLVPGTPYSCFLRAFPKTFYDRPFRKRKRATDGLRQYDIFSSSDFLEPQKTGGQQNQSLELIVGIVVAVLAVLTVCIAIVVVVIVCMMRKKRYSFRAHIAEVDSNSTTTDGGTPQYINTPDLGRKTNGIELKQMDMISPAFNGSMFEPSGPIDKEDFVAHVEKFDASRQLLFQEEFEWISNNSPWHPAEASNNPLNSDKNRYHNITAFDHTRVKLAADPGVECADYINANHILGYSGEVEYIATQGPIEQTVVEFWAMVWEQNTSTILMLTNLVELGKVKCTQYWPINGTVIYGNVKVTLEHVVELPDYIIRNLNVSSIITGTSRSVLQFHYTGWPDYGAPKLAAPLLNFLRAVNISNPPTAGPIIVHCSAGVGRSGTVIAIDYCLKQLRSENYMNPRGFISQMRNQRNYMVQTDPQYTFIHYALLEAITYGDTSFELATFSDSYQQLQEVNPSTGRSLLDEEFRRIGTVKTMTKKSSFQQKVRQKGAPPRHFNSSFMGSIGGSGSTTMELFSAHYVTIYSNTNKLVVSDGPNEDTAAKWWQMVWDEDAAYIVMLTPQDVESTFVYWSGKESVVRHGNIVVEVVSESAEHLYTCRQIKLTNAKVEGISHSVQQWQFIGWTMQGFPSVPDFMLFVCDILKGMDSLDKQQRILVHDIDSLGPSGIICSLFYCIQRLGKERMVDVFQAVQSMRLQRPGSVQNVEQYAFIYDCVYEFIQTYSSTTP